MSQKLLKLLLISVILVTVNSSCNNAIASLQWKVTHLETNVDQNVQKLMKKLNDLEQTLLQQLQSTSFVGDNRNFTQLIKRKRRVPGRLVGCFGGRERNEMLRGHINMLKTNSVDKCVEICQNNLFVYAAISRQYCSCGNAYPKIHYHMFNKYDESRCTYPCDGNSSQICGGEWPLKSVYETGIEQYYFDNDGKEFIFELSPASENVYFDVDVLCDYCYDDDD
uniref:CSON013551 protein n=1 Tax=Culicoides sonorensis TaxID=179676 RepID=A0A336KPV7_CULSO